MQGRRFCSATSCARRCFLTVSGKYDPPLTVASLATTTHSRPSTTPIPVTIPVAAAECHLSCALSQLVDEAFHALAPALEHLVPLNGCLEERHVRSLQSRGEQRRTPAALCRAGRSLDHDRRRSQSRRLRGSRRRAGRQGATQGALRTKPPDHLQGTEAELDDRRLPDARLGAEGVR